MCPCVCLGVHTNMHYRQAHGTHMDMHRDITPDHAHRYVYIIMCTSRCTWRHPHIKCTYVHMHTVTHTDLNMYT